jgi:hypothetical protein
MGTKQQGPGVAIFIIDTFKILRAWHSGSQYSSKLKKRSLSWHAHRGGDVLVLFLNTATAIHVATEKDAQNCCVKGW